MLGIVFFLLASYGLQNLLDLQNLILLPALCTMLLRLLTPSCVVPCTDTCQFIILYEDYFSKYAYSLLICNLLEIALR